MKHLIWVQAVLSHEEALSGAGIKAAPLQSQINDATHLPAFPLPRAYHWIQALVLLLQVQLIILK